MNIILEGPDNAGKTTLAKVLAEKTGFTIKSPGGPIRSSDDMVARMTDYFGNYSTNTIFDRHPCISQDIYAKLHKTPKVPNEWMQVFRQCKFVMVYCRPPEGRTAEGHKAKAHDRPEELKRIEEQYDLLKTAYDLWAVNNAHIIYRISDSTEDVCDRIIATALPPFDPVADIQAFHEKFELSYRNSQCRRLPPSLSDFRIKFMAEELNEYRKYADHAMRTGNAHAITNGLAGMLDSLVDLTYVALGTAYLHGFDFKEAWRRVHLANMMKQRAKRASDSTRASVYDVLKPEGWEPPDHHDLVKNHIHR